MSTHYQALGVAVTASYQEIRDAYRRQVKAVHPDINQGDPSSVERMKRLVVAWEVLRDPFLREDYDRSHGLLHVAGTQFDYAEFLRERSDDHESQAKLVFYDLLHDNPDEALQIYDSLVETGDFELAKFLGREDFMDCAFLLAEEYEARDEFLPAFDLLSAIVRFEEQRPYFRHFMAEVFERLRVIVCLKMTPSVGPDTVLRCISQMLEWHMPRREVAFCYKKAAEIHLSCGRRVVAMQCLERGLQLDRRLSGVRKLQQDLGYFEAV